MPDHREKLSDEALALDGYLSRYSRLRSQEKALERRRRQTIEDFTPLKAIAYDGMPKGGGESLGSAALAFELDEIDTRIGKQIKEIRKEYLKITQIMEFLPAGGIERAILEDRYIDGCGWEAICRAENISRTPAVQHWRKGLYMLLDFAKIRRTVKKYMEESEGRDDPPDEG